MMSSVIVKTIAWTIALFEIKVKLFQVFDNIITVMILMYLFIFIFDM